MSSWEDHANRVKFLSKNVIILYGSRRFYIAWIRSHVPFPVYMLGLMNIFRSMKSDSDADEGGIRDMKVESAGSVIVAGRVSREEIVNSFVAFIREVNELLHKEMDLSPANQLVTNVINHLSQQLRSRYLPDEVQAVLSDNYIRMNQIALQDKLSKAEFLAELEASRSFCHSGDSIPGLITKLPNWNIYMALVSHELSVLRLLIRQAGQAENLPIIFVGSGPMPLSPIILHLLSGVQVVCLEINAEAYEASCHLLDQLGLGTKVKVVLADGAKFDYSAYNRIFIASLVRNKPAVLEQIRRTSTHPLVAVRTAEGMSQIMYEAIDEAQLNKLGWMIADRTMPEEGLVINSTLFLHYAETAASKG